MSTPKHTPGPWEVTGHHSREVIATNPGTYKPCMTVAKVGGYWDGEAQANAHLIAAAPAMYEALRTIKNQSLGPDWTAEQAVAFVKQYAKETLAQAEGGRS